MMNKFLLILALSLTSVHAADQSDPPSVEPSALIFKNGDKLSGDFLTYQQGALKINSLHFKEESTTFDTKQLLEIALPDKRLSRNQELKEHTHVATLTLEDRYGYKNERDKIKGAILKVSEKSITLATDYAGIVEVDKSLIHHVAVGSVTPMVYLGPNSIEEWHLHGDDDCWTFLHHSLTSTSSSSGLAKDVNLPARALLQFEFKCNNTPRFTTYFYSDDASEDRPDNYYSFSISNGQLTMNRHSEDIPRQALQPKLKNVRSTNSEMSDAVRVALYMDKKKGVFHLFINDTYKNTFIDTAPKPKQLGTSIHFNDNRGLSLKLKNIQVSHWIGAAPIPRSENITEELSGEGQIIHLTNGDVMRGILGEIKDEAIAVKTPHATFQVPLAGISTLMQRNTRENQPRADINDIRAHFHDGGWIIIDTTKIDSEFIYGNSEALGDCKFRLDAFKQIDFNIYSRTHNKIRKEREW